jgi:hypothetical protein
MKIARLDEVARERVVHNPAIEFRTRFCVDRFVTLVFMRDADLDEPGAQQREIIRSFACKR